MRIFVVAAASRFDGRQEGGAAAVGSQPLFQGVPQILTRAGNYLTNNHLVEQAHRKLQVALNGDPTLYTKHSANKATNGRN